MPRQCMSVISFLCAVLMLCPGAQSSPGLALAAYQDAAKKRVSDVKTIVIDPGHGGKDEGAKGEYDLKEKDIALRIGLRVRDLLAKEGFRVLMTRQDDRYLSLQDRAQAVHAMDADFFLSIHANAAQNRLARGYETFYLSDPANDAYDPEKGTEEGNWHYEHFLENEKEFGKEFLRLLDKASSEDRAESIELAQMIHDTLKQRLRWRDRGVKRARFFVLRQTDIPAVLIEIGFLSNPKDERLLKSPRYQREIAKAIADGLIAYRERQKSANRVAGK